MTSPAQQRRNLIRRAANLAVVCDGADRWVTPRADLIEYIGTHPQIDISRNHPSNLPRVIVCGDDAYQSLCDSTPCLVSQEGGQGPAGYSAHELIDALLDRGAIEYHVA